MTPNLAVANLKHELLELSPQRSSARATGECEEVLFVLAGRGALSLAGTDHALEPESGAYLAPGESYELSNDGAEPLRLISVRIPDPAPPAQTPDGAAVRAAQSVAKPSKWQNLGHTERVVWGECQGSGSNPYQVRADLDDGSIQANLQFFAAMRGP